MAERDAIDLIREQMNRIEALGGLHANHEAFKRWHEETKTILEKAFSPKSIHCQTFLALKFRELGAIPFSSPEIDRMNAARYRRDLENAKNLLQGAIKELTLDRTLFRKIQTTRRSVEITLKGEYYISAEVDPGVAQAIHAVFEGSGLHSLSGREVSIQQRIDQIRQSQFGIYDLPETDKAEVFLEIGAALALGKKIIVLYKKGQCLREAVKVLTTSGECIEYEGLSDLSEKLKKTTKL